jgi:hypothetical protein
MRRLLIPFLFAACSTIQAGSQTGSPVAPGFPSWVVVFPGATAQERQAGDEIESSYVVGATMNEVLAHFRKLFEQKGLAFDPEATGDGFFIRSKVPECDLAISIRRRNSEDDQPETAVKVTCSAKQGSSVGTVWAPVQDKPKPDTTEIMKKFDKPVYPAPRTEPGIRWPSWLVEVNGSKPNVQRLSGALKSTFTAAPPRGDIEYFYSSLFDSHDYHVSKGASPAAQFGSWLQATADPDPELGRKVVIWIRIKPVGGNFNVEIKVL